jgi:predicted nucleic acid-binding Zn finger protein
MPLVADGRVKVLRAEHSKRQLFHVEASKGRDTWYRVLPCHYCECPAFFQLVCKGDGRLVRSPSIKSLHSKVSPSWQCLLC